MEADCSKLELDWQLYHNSLQRKENCHVTIRVCPSRFTFHAPITPRQVKSGGNSSPRIFLATLGSISNRNGNLRSQLWNEQFHLIRRNVELELHSFQVEPSWYLHTLPFWSCPKWAQCRGNTKKAKLIFNLPKSWGFVVWNFYKPHLRQHEVLGAKSYKDWHVYFQSCGRITNSMSWISVFDRFDQQLWVGVGMASLESWVGSCFLFVMIRSNDSNHFRI